MTRFSPANCPHCEYDRRFPDLEAGGWIQQDNNGPIVSCPICNDDGSYPVGGIGIDTTSLFATDRGQLSDYQRPHDRAPLEVEREA